MSIAFIFTYTNDHIKLKKKKKKNTGQTYIKTLIYFNIKIQPSNL